MNTAFIIKLSIDPLRSSFFSLLLYGCQGKSDIYDIDVSVLFGFVQKKLQNLTQRGRS